MLKHEERLLNDAIQTCIKTEIKNENLKLALIIENIILVLVIAGVLTWIGL